jgi:ligand-binding SRPBCC domain-containing protein
VPIIRLQTQIKNNREVVFDLSRSIDLHKISTQHTNERAIAGKTEGLIELGETVTWRARHFGVYQELTSKVTEFDRPNYFADEMLKGAFKRFKHEHHFVASGEETLVTDLFDYTSPFGFVGRLADKLFLEKYMAELLTIRNEILKNFAESEQWKLIVKEQ